MRPYQVYDSRGVRTKKAQNRGAYEWVDLEARYDMYPRAQPRRRGRLRRPGLGDGGGGGRPPPPGEPGRRRRSGDQAILIPDAEPKPKAKPKNPTIMGGSSGSGGGLPPPMGLSPPGTQRKDNLSIVDRDQHWWNQEVQKRFDEKFAKHRAVVPAPPPQRAGIEEKVKHFISTHGLEAAIAAFGVAGLAAAGVPLLGLAGGAALAAVPEMAGVEMGFLAEPLLGRAAGAAINAAEQAVPAHMMRQSVRRAGGYLATAAAKRARHRLMGLG